MAVEIIRDNSYRIIVLGQEDKIVYPDKNESSLLAAVADGLAAVAEALAETETKPSKPPAPPRKRGRPVKKKPAPKEQTDATSS